MPNNLYEDGSAYSYLLIIQHPPLLLSASARDLVTAAWEPPQLGGIQRTDAASKKQMLKVLMLTVALSIILIKSRNTSKPSTAICSSNSTGEVKLLR